MANNFGLITDTDSNVLMKTIDMIVSNSNEESFCVTEVGVYGGATGRGIKNYLESSGYECILTGIDNNKDGEPIRYMSAYNNFIFGNSTEVYNRIPDGSQHFVFIDGDHSFIGVIADFFAYAPKVKVGGLMAFHDTGSHIKEFKDFQHGDRENPDAYISVRKALLTLGLLNEYSVSNIVRYKGMGGWQLAFCEADPTDEAGGISVFQKISE